MVTWSDFSRCMICSMGPSSSTKRLRARQTTVSAVTASTDAPLHPALRYSGGRGHSNAWPTR